MESLNLLHAIHAAFRRDLTPAAYLRAVGEVLLRELSADGVSGCLASVATGQRDFFTLGPAGAVLQQPTARDLLLTAVGHHAETVSLRPSPLTADRSWALVVTSLSPPSPTTVGLLCQFPAPTQPSNQHQLLRALQLVALLLQHHGSSIDNSQSPTLNSATPANSAGDSSAASTAPVDPTSRPAGSTGFVPGERELWQACFSSTNLDETCFAVANDGRKWLDCERVSVLTRQGTRLRLRAISGQSNWERRSPAVQYLQQLAQRCLPMESVVAYPEDEELPPQIIAACESYAPLAQVSSLYIVPLRVPSPIDTPSADSTTVGVLVAEYRDRLANDPAARSVRQAQIAQVAAPATYALRHASARPGGVAGWLEQISQRGATRSRLAKWGLAAFAVLGILGLAAVLRTDLQVYAQGVLRPVDRRHVYAQTEGIVQEVHVRHGQQITAGDRLITLENPELSRQIANVLGQIQAAKQRLSDLDALRLAENSVALPPTETPHRLTTEYRQVSQQLENLQLQYEMMIAQQDSLNVRSPITGTVVTWDVEQRWQARPVSRGDELLTIMAPGGPWELEVSLADRDAGPVVAAFGDPSAPPTVKYSLGTQPEIQYETSVTQVAEATQYDPELGQAVIVTARIPEGQLADPRMGAEVRAKIACGRVSWAYAGLRDLIRFVHTRIIFPWT